MALIDDFKNGKRYGNDWKAPSIQHMNDLVGTIVDNDALIASLASNPNTIDANKVGTPNVEIIGDGTDKKFKFSNLKGETGNPGSFGVPTASATTLAAGSAATAKVTASGTNDNKIFTFEFGIPKGADAKGAVTVNGAETPINFTSDPQTQLNTLNSAINNNSLAIKDITDGTTPVSVKKNDGTMGQIIEDENGVLKFGDIIIPQKKVLWENANGATSASWGEALKLGDTVEITYKIHLGMQTVRCHIYQLSPNSVSGVALVRADWGNQAIGLDHYATANIGVNLTSASGYFIKSDTYTTGDPVTLFKVVKVIE